MLLDIIKGMCYSHDTITPPTPFLSHLFLVPEHSWDNHVNTPNNYTQGRKYFFATLFALQLNNPTPHEPYSSAFYSHFSTTGLSYPPNWTQLISPYHKSVHNGDLYLDFNTEKYAANGVKEYTPFLHKNYHTQCGSNTLNTLYWQCHHHQSLFTSMDESCSSWRH